MYKDNLQYIFKEICLGYSNILWNNENVYIKHLSNFDIIDIESFYDQYLDAAKDRGIKDRKARLDWLESKNLWNKAKDIEIKKQEGFLENARKTRSKLFIKNQIHSHDKIIEEESKKLNILLAEREDLIGLTAEKIAEQKMQFYYMMISLFRDKKFENSYFSQKEMDDLDEDDSYRLLGFYSETMKRFGIKNIKKISISTFFTNNFYLCGENTQGFFGIPLYLLTNYQSLLLSYGIYFKNLLSNNPNLPPDILGDPDKMEEFVQRARSLQENIEKTDSSAKSVGLVGATSQDFKELNLKQDEDLLKNKRPFENAK